MKKSIWPKLHINSALVDMLVASSLFGKGITDAKSYFGVFASHIVRWVIVCAIVGTVFGGFSGMFWGAIFGLVMPLFLEYLTIILPYVMTQVAGLFIGIAWMLFCVWLLMHLIFG